MNQELITIPKTLPVEMGALPATKGKTIEEKRTYWRAHSRIMWARNPERMRTVARAYRAANQGKVRAWANANYTRNKQKRREQARLRRLANNEKIRARDRVYMKVWRTANREKLKASRHRYQIKHRGKILVKAKTRIVRMRDELNTAYGGRCMCCGESQREFLTLDHINGGGAKHRREGMKSTTLYKWLKDNGWPRDNFQLLCWNCNSAKGVYGSCPHQKKKEDL